MPTIQNVCNRDTADAVPKAVRVKIGDGANHVSTALPELMWSLTQRRRQPRIQPRFLAGATPLRLVRSVIANTDIGDLTT